jgi:hypothetical protein
MRRPLNLRSASKQLHLQLQIRGHNLALEMTLRGVEQVHDTLCTLELSQSLGDYLPGRNAAPSLTMRVAEQQSYPRPAAQHHARKPFPERNRDLGPSRNQSC